MKRSACLTALLASAQFSVARNAPRPDRSLALPPILTSRSVIAIASTPRSSFRTPFRSPTPSTTSFSA